MIREKVLTVGESPALVGILSEPEHGLDKNQPVLVVLNSGLLPRVGPGRAAVLATRSAAELGLGGLRFDLSGVGDSDARRDTAGFEDRWVADTRAVMDHLEKTRGVTRFILMGLCSGADNSFETGVRDERVVGLVLLDGYAYKTPGFFARYYARRVLAPGSLGRLAERSVSGLLRRVVPVRRPSPPPPPSPSPPSPSQPPPRLTEDGHDELLLSGPQPQYWRDFPPRDRVAQNLRVMLRRGLTLCVIHSGARTMLYNYAEQFRDAFRDVDFGNALTVHYLENADHTFTELAQQALLQEAIHTFLKEFRSPTSRVPW